MKIKTFSIKNYKSFQETDEITFDECENVIVGKNNAGKSSLLEALTLNIKPVPHQSLEVKKAPNIELLYYPTIEIILTITREELFDYICSNKTVSIFPKIKMGRSFEEEKIKIEEWINKSSSFELRCEIRHERNIVKIDYWDLPFEIIANEYLALNVKDGRIVYTDVYARGPNLTTMFSNLINSFMNQIYLFKPERYKISRSNNGINYSLKSDASNLPEVIDNLKSNPAKFNRLNKLVQEIFPEVRLITTVNRPNNQVEIMIWNVDPGSEREDLAISLSESGTGIGQVLAILYVVLNSFSPQTIIIDEPQSFLHPGAIKKLINILERHSEHQYVLATHSSTIINSLRNPSIIFLEKKESRTVSTVLSRENTKDILRLLDNLGIKLSDTFGADSVIWVEGPTEEKVFPSLMRGFISPGIQICAVKNTGDLDGKKAELVFSIYKKVSKGNQLIPRALAFIFDSENKTYEKQKDIQRIANGIPVYFLKRTMFENYIINPEAIFEIMYKRSIEYDINDFNVTIEKIKDWILTNLNDSCYYQSNYSDNNINKIDIIHGAKFLSALFESFFNASYKYKKITDSVEIAMWIYKNNKIFLNELIGELSSFMNEISY